MDHLYTLNDETPKIKCQPPHTVDPALIFGVQSKLFLTNDKPVGDGDHDEVETLTIGALGVQDHRHTHVPEPDSKGAHAPRALAKETLDAALQLLPKDTVWRVKGFILLSEGGWHILNWAFGRYTLTPTLGDGEGVRVTVMGRRGEVRRACAKLVSVLSQQ
jgi:hypothetical protein